MRQGSSHTSISTAVLTTSRMVKSHDVAIVGRPNHIADCEHVLPPRDRSLDALPDVVVALCSSRLGFHVGSWRSGFQVRASVYRGGRTSAQYFPKSLGSAPVGPPRCRQQLRRWMPGLPRRSAHGRYTIPEVTSRPAPQVRPLRFLMSGQNCSLRVCLTAALVTRAMRPHRQLTVALLNRHQTPLLSILRGG